jgi:hypothetical protein
MVWIKKGVYIWKFDRNGVGAYSAIIKIIERKPSNFMDFYIFFI